MAIKGGDIEVGEYWEYWMKMVSQVSTCSLHNVLVSFTPWVSSSASMILAPCPAPMFWFLAPNAQALDSDIGF
jgi:hypothetical protein